VYWEFGRKLHTLTSLRDDKKERAVESERAVVEGQGGCGAGRLFPFTKSHSIVRGVLTGL
jgi:hypothetical protein